MTLRFDCAVVGEKRFTSPGSKYALLSSGLDPTVESPCECQMFKQKKKTKKKLCVFFHLWASEIDSTLPDGKHERNPHDECR